MAQFTLEEVLVATGGTYVGPKGDMSFMSVSTDTRDIGRGSLFVALKGITFDGHDFLAQALEKGAVGLVVEKGRSFEGATCIEVENTLTAYQQLANFHRRRFAIPVVGITGSSGKTTTKEMVAAVLETTYKVLKTEKNYNNEIGLPKTLLNLTEEHEVCVLEMGMRGLGQIDELARIAEPTVGVVTNVGTSHIELLGSQEAIGRAKAELIQALPKDGVAVLNEDDPFVKKMESCSHAKIMTYGIENRSTVRGTQLKYKRDGIKFTCFCFDEVFDIFLPMIGVHNVYDALAAIAVGRALGVSTSSKFVKAFSQFTGIPMRQEIVSFEDITVLNDAYNANPQSMEESIKALGQLEGKRKVAFIGDMLELGESSLEEHRRIGRLLGEEGYHMVLTFGDESKKLGIAAREAGVPFVFHGKSHAELVNRYLETLEKGDVVLLKGSRGLRMERVVEDLKDRIQ